MTVITLAIVAKLREELREVMDGTLALAAATRFRRVPAEGLRVVAGLAPDVEPAAQAEALRRRLWRWHDVTAALVRRHAIALPSPLEPIVRQAEVYVRLRRTTPPEITELRWRAQFRDELDRLRMQLEHIMDLCIRAAAGCASDAPRAVETLDVSLSDVGEGEYRVDVRWNGDEQRSNRAYYPPSELESLLAQCRTPTAVAQTPALAATGRRLFEFLFHGATAVLYAGAAKAADDTTALLCIRLHVAYAGALALAPWELLHDHNGFVALRRSVAITRVVEAPPVHRASRIPLRILATVSAPRTLRALDTDRELKLLRSAVGGLELLGRLQLDVAPDGSLDTLRRCLERSEDENRPYDGWHFIGHGRFDRATRRGELALTKDDGSHHFAGGLELETMFRNHPLKLVVLNACDTALGAVQEARAGLAPTLIRCGAEQVIAMQFPISDPAAIVLAEEAYGALAAGSNVLSAVAEARRAIFCRPTAVEWMTPVVFVRTDPYANSS